MKVVLDANVLVSALGTRGLCEGVYQLCLEKHVVVLSEAILDEVRRNLRTKFKLGSARIAEILSLLASNAQIVTPAPVPAGACRDADDLLGLGTLVASKADCLVTGDQDLLSLEEYEGIPILSPRGFYDRLR